MGIELHSDPTIREWLEAAERGDLARLIEGLDRGISIDTTGVCNTTALMLALVAGQVDAVRLLLDRGADLSPENCRDETALTLAIIGSRTWDGYWIVDRPDPRPLQMLLAAGARFSLRDAVLLNDISIARARLEAGADPNAGEGSYHGPVLKIAAELGYVEMVDLLLDHGADIEATDDLCRPPLPCAASCGRIEVVRRLLDRGAHIDAGWPNESALASAALGRHRELVELLLDRGARRGIIDAAFLGDEAIFEVFLEEELRGWRDSEAVDWIAPCGRIALLAAGAGQVKILRRLLDRGARLFIEDRDEHSLLAEAARSGHADAVRLLIQRGADVHAVGYDGLTPLAWAIREGRDEVAAILRAAGATG